MSASAQSCIACRQGDAAFPFTMAFQPIIDLTEQKIDAHEALVRGPGGESASSVLGQVNDSNLYAFDQACRVRAIEMAVKVGLQGRLNINFLPNAVYDPKACIRLTLKTAARYGFPLNRITFEFTENERIIDHQHLIGIITEYRRHGFKIALDDFATGYSGLSRLAELQPDIVKLDRALVQDCDQNRMRLAIIASMVGLANEFGFKIVAEGVERVGEVEALRNAGVRFMQGFYFARPCFEGAVQDSGIPWPARPASEPDGAGAAAGRQAQGGHADVRRPVAPGPA
ncbi:MAG TPA: EAL domain-containing protein [Rhodopila sp.]|nr:EAL domain-containing protein [Rhodopila sp.]